MHRDIKPANLLWSEDHVTVKISDFGVSVYDFAIKGKEEELTATEHEFLELMGDDFLNRIAGTPVFLAPELCPNQAADADEIVQNTSEPPSKFAIDTWALGVTYYCLLFGHPPWEESNYWPLLNRVVTEDFEIPPTMGSDKLPSGGRHPAANFPDGFGVLSILDGLLTKDPRKRLTLTELKVSRLICFIFHFDAR